MPTEKTALVLGGGVAGMMAALSLADQGFPVHLVERSDTLGGSLRHVHYTLDDLGLGHTLHQTDGSNGHDPQEYLTGLIEQVQADPLVTIHMNTELAKTSGFAGNFTSVLQPTNDAGERWEVRHGATILATGGVEYRGNEYGYGTDPRILTQQEFEKVLSGWSKSHEGNGSTRQRGDRATGEMVTPELVDPSPHSPLPDSVAMILCVGPAEEYCGRICCTTALKNALMLKRLNPAAQVTVIYRDIRTYGFKEQLYNKAREAGVLFVHYDFDRKPDVVSENGHLTLRVWEEVLGKELELKPDLLVLSTPVVPSEGARDLSTRLKVSQDMDGFFLEAHVKLRPVDFSSDGIFMAGLAHYPKLLDESIIQAQAAAARAAVLLSKDTMETGGRVAVVDETQCVGCLTCVRTCPYDAPRIVANLMGVGNILGAAQVEAAICHGCGSCAAVCPAKAIDLMHYTDAQMLPKVDALFAPQGALQDSN